MRKALDSVINKSNLVKFLLRHFAILVSYLFHLSFNPDYSRGKDYEYKPGKARRLLTFAV